MTINLVVVKVAPNPVRLPVVGKEQAYLKVLHVAIKCLLPIVVAVSDSGINLPPAAIAAL